MIFRHISTLKTDVFNFHPPPDRLRQHPLGHFNQFKKRQKHDPSVSIITDNNLLIIISRSQRGRKRIERANNPYLTRSRPPHTLLDDRIHMILESRLRLVALVQARGPRPVIGRCDCSSNVKRPAFSMFTNVKLNSSVNTYIYKQWRVSERSEGAKIGIARNDASDPRVSSACFSAFIKVQLPNVGQTQPSSGHGSIKHISGLWPLDGAKPGKTFLRFYYERSRSII